MASAVALPVQTPSPAEMTSHDGDTDGRGQFWKFPSSRARATLPSRSNSSPVNVPDAVQNRSELNPPPCVPSGPVKRWPSCVMVNDPEQPPQFSVLPVARLRNTVVPKARHRPLKVGKSWATTAVAEDVRAKLTGDGPVGKAVTSPQAQDSRVA